MVVPSSITTMRVGDRAAQARDRLVARAAVGDDLGDHRVELGRDDVALGDAACRRARRGRSAGAAAGCGPGVGAKPERRVLGVQARLDRVAAGGGRIALEPAAGRDVQLQLDEVERR